MYETIKEVIKEIAPEWVNNEKFIINVKTLYEIFSLYYEEDEEKEMEVINGYYKEIIIEAIEASINDYEAGETDF